MQIQSLQTVLGYILYYDYHCRYNPFKQFLIISYTIIINADLILKKILGYILYYDYHCRYNPFKECLVISHAMIINYQFRFNPYKIFWLYLILLLAMHI